MAVGHRATDGQPRGTRPAVTRDALGRPPSAPARTCDVCSALAEADGCHLVGVIHYPGRGSGDPLVKGRTWLTTRSDAFVESLPGALKNAIDCASRPWGQNAFDHIPAGVIGASIGQIGTAVAQCGGCSPRRLTGRSVAGIARELNERALAVHAAAERFDDGRSRRATSSSNPPSSSAAPAARRSANISS
jgi:NADPH-dependent FMN reductase